MSAVALRLSAWILWAALACACLADAAAAAQLTPAAAINKAGRQRMLTQRIVKAYCQVGLGMMPQVSKAQLSDSIQLFDTQLSELKPAALDPQSKAAFAKMEKLWAPFKAVAMTPATRDGAARLSAGDDELLNAAQQLTVALQGASGGEIGRLVNVAGRQRMLSQRLAKFYMLRSWGLDSPALRNEIGSARTEFAGALATLQAAPESTPAIKKELDAVATQWEWFQNALTLEGAASYGLIVANASEAILNSMDLITAMYEQLPSR